MVKNFREILSTLTKEICNEIKKITGKPFPEKKGEMKEMGMYRL